MILKPAIRRTGCRCCVGWHSDPKKERRRLKRRERNQWKKENT